jgi:hsp70-interacting protein
MQSLLRWSLENSNPQGASPSGDGAASSPQTLDPAIIDAILGKPDAVQMKEDVSVAVDTERSEDDRLAALDHLEMVSFEHFAFQMIVVQLCGL